MKLCLATLACAAGLSAQMMPMGAPQQRAVQTYDDLKSALGLTDDQVAKLREIQQEKVSATQSYYGKMAEKQQELTKMLDDSAADPAKVGKAMLDLQQMRRTPPPSAADSHEKALGVLSGAQKSKLEKLEEAQKLRGAVDQATQLALLNPPAPPARPMMGAPTPARPASK